MPTRNVLKIYGEEQYYHVHNRGVNGMQIFRDSDDYRFFLGLLKRHLSEKPAVDRVGRALPHYKDMIDLVAFALMPNHFHLMVYLKEKAGLEKLMRSVMTAYSRYFNTKYERRGPLFQSAFLASRITGEAYYWHISRYIHLNPIDISGVDYLEYPYSSIDFFQGKRRAEWVHPEHVVQTESERQKYSEFLADYEDIHAVRKQLKEHLAGS